MAESGSGGSGPATIDWVPNKETVATWNLVSAPMGLAAAAVFGLVACRGNLPAGFSVNWQIMLAIALAILALFVVHELIHGAVMAAFGAHPEFGVTKVGGSAMGSAFYATSPGFLFTRTQYLALAMAPTVLLSILGILLCLTPLAAVAWLPFTFHFMGCVGDCAIARRTLQEPSSTKCEDLRDGVRFIRAA